MESIRRSIDLPDSPPIRLRFDQLHRSHDPRTVQEEGEKNRKDETIESERTEAAAKRNRAEEEEEEGKRRGREGERVDNVEPSVPPNYTAVQTHANPENKLYLLCKLAAYWRTERTVLLPRE